MVVADEAAHSVNQVVLVGRLSAPATERVLPSGDTLCSWRLVVDRPQPLRPPPVGVRIPTVDTVDCVTWTAAVRRSIGKAGAGDVISVQGALRRRFWQTPAGAVSRYEVDVVHAKRLSRAVPKSKPPTAAVLSRRGQKTVADGDKEAGQVQASR